MASLSMLRPQLASRRLLSLASRTSSSTSTASRPSASTSVSPFSTYPRSLASQDRTSDRIPTNDPNEVIPAQNVSATNSVPVSPGGMQDSSAPLQEMTDEAEERRVMQAPNRATVWTRNQQPRERAMTGPRFEQTIMSRQPRPEAAISLIHQQPVRWTHKRQVSCDGGGGPLGHPRIFINVDKPQICMCTYCGLPFANEHHRKHLESLPSTTYPLEPTGAPAEVPESQRVSDEAFGQR